MSPEIIQAPFSYPRSRPRAATDRMQSTRTSSPLPPRLPSQQAMSPPAISPRNPEVGSRSPGVGDHVRARASSGPLRHPKPLSPSDIHSMLEQEQEAIVNRLSRELSLLRRQTASVASTSPTSTTLNDPLDGLHGSPYIAGPIYSTASRRHRSSSNLGASYFPAIQGSRGNGRSRRPSLVSPQRSESLVSVTSQPPERKQSDPSHVTYSSRLYPRRSSVSQQRTPSGSSAFRPDEMTFSGEELESLKSENEELRRRIQDLELELGAQSRQSSDQPLRS